MEDLTNNSGPGTGRMGEPNGYAMHWFRDRSQAYDITMAHTSFFIIVNASSSTCITCGKFPETAPLTLSEYFSNAQWKTVINTINKSNQNARNLAIILMSLLILFFLLVIPLGALSLIPAILMLVLLLGLYPLLKWHRSKIVTEFNLKYFNNGFYWWVSDKQYIGFWTPLLTRGTNNPHDIRIDVESPVSADSKRDEQTKGYDMELVKDANKGGKQHKRRRSSLQGGGSVLDADALGDLEDMGKGGEWIDPNTPSNTPPGRVTVEIPDEADFSGGDTITDDGEPPPFKFSEQEQEDGMFGSVMPSLDDDDSPITQALASEETAPVSPNLVMDAERVSVVITGPANDDTAENEPWLDFYSAKESFETKDSQDRERPIDPDSVPHAYRQKPQNQEEDLTLGVQDGSGRRARRRSRSKSPRLQELSAAFEQNDTAVAPKLDSSVMLTGWGGATSNKG